MANFGLAICGWCVRATAGRRNGLGLRLGRQLPLDGARVFDRLEDALADLRLVMATTARPRRRCCRS